MTRYYIPPSLSLPPGMEEQKRKPCILEVGLVGGGEQRGDSCLPLFHLFAHHRRRAPATAVSQPLLRRQLTKMGGG
jgi:hypothetical protein